METERPDPECFIGAEGTEAVGEPRRTGEARRRHVEEMLDAALACTFPASDPVGCIRVPDPEPPEDGPENENEKGPA